MKGKRKKGGKDERVKEERRKEIRKEREQGRGKKDEKKMKTW